MERSNEALLNSLRILLEKLVNTGIVITSEVEIKNDSGVALPSNVTQLGTVAINLGAGAIGTGTQRITLASNDPAVTALQLIDNAVSGAGFNISQINGVAPLMGNGGTGTGSHRVTLASDGTAISTAGYISVKIDQTTPGTTNFVQNKAMPDATSTFCPSASDSTAYVASQIAKASAGTLYGISGYNSLASDQWIQVHDTTSLPADTAIPIITFVARAQSNFSWDSGKFGKYFSTGITICNSTTGPTKTIGAANCWFNVLYS